MRDRRTEITAALEQLVAHGRWQDAQVLGLHIARTKWPELEATEFGSDGGEDATSFGPCADGKRRIFASSLSAKIDKIRSDARRLRERGVQLDVLVFATPEAVLNIQAAEWRETVYREFGHDLHVIARAEIVQTLEDPRYDWISKAYLHLDFSDLPDAARDEAQACKAAAQVLDGFERQHGFDRAHMVDLNLLRRSSQASKEGSQASLAEAISSLAGRHPVVLSGPPGAGKTITLLRLAELLLGDPTLPIPLVISVPGWLAGPDDLITHAAATFEAYGLPSGRAREMIARGRIALLLNGWNEAAEGGATRATALIRDFTPKFPGAPLALATRQTRVPHPIAGERGLLERMLRDIVLEKVPIGSGSSYYLVPRASAALKRRLFALFASDSPARPGAYAALNVVRQLRAECGLHPDEPVHPDIDRVATFDCPWPLAPCDGH